MTVYVDSAMIAAQVGRHDTRWSHLMSDQLDPTELHAFAARVGLQRGWFQPGRSLADRDAPYPPGDHYDVTVGKRYAAVAAGAVEIDRDGLVALMGRRRDAWRQLLAEARAWVTECAWIEDAEEIDEMSDAAILRGVQRHYAGGLRQLARDALIDAAIIPRQHPGTRPPPEKLRRAAVT